MIFKTRDQRPETRVSSRVLILFCLGSLVFCLLSPVLVQAKQELIDRVVAVVNDDVITQSEMDGLLRPLYEQYMREYSGETVMKMLGEAQQKILSQLIEDRLVYQEAVKKKIEASESDIDKEMNYFKQKFGSSVELEKVLKSENASVADLKERLKKQALIRKVHDSEIRSKVIVSPKEQETYYADHKAEFSAQEQVRVISLTIKKSDEARQKGMADEAAQARLVALRQRILKGEDFDKIVKDNSEDKHSDEEGKGNWILRGQMIPAVDEVIFKTKAGQITEEIETPIGYHVFKVAERQEPVQKSYEQVREQIYDILFRKKSEERFNAWMEGLKKNAYISIKGKQI